MSELDEDADSIPNMRRVRTNRSELQTFLPTPRLIKAFEDLTANVQEAIPAAIMEGDAVSQAALFGAETALGKAESARGAVDQLIPLVQQLINEMATDRSLSGNLARISTRLEQMETLVRGANVRSDINRLTRRVEQVETLVIALGRANTEIQRLQSRIANLETLTLGA